MVKEMDHHYFWEACVRKGTNNALATFLDYPNSAFNVAHVLCSRRGVEGSMLDIISYLLKLIVHKDGTDREPCTCVNVDNLMKEESKLVSSTGGGCMLDRC